MEKTYLWAIGAGTLFGVWPFVMGKSGLLPIVAAVILTISSLLVYPLFLSGGVDIKTMTATAILLAVVAGLMNGFGTIAFQKVIAGQDVGVIATGILVSILTQIVVAVLIGFFVGHTDLYTIRKLAGIASASLAVYLLVGK